MNDELKDLKVGEFVTCLPGFRFSPRLMKFGRIVKVTARTIVVKFGAISRDGSTLHEYERTFSNVHGHEPGHNYYGESIRAFDPEDAAEAMADHNRFEAVELLRAGYTDEEAAFLADALRQRRAAEKAGA